MSTKIPCWSIKHVSIDQSGPGLCHCLQEYFVISSKLLRHSQKFWVSPEVKVNSVHQEVPAYSLAEDREDITIREQFIRTFPTLNIFLVEVETVCHW